MKSLLLAATAIAMLGGTAFAQTSQSNSGSNATVNTASGSQSQSIASPKVNVIGNPIGNGASSSNSGAKATSNTRSTSRSAAVGNTTNVTVGYSGGDGSGSNGSGSTGTGSTGSGGGSASNGTGSTGSGGSGTTGTGYTGTNYSGSYTVRNTPEVIAPSVVGGNPCAVGASGGLSLPGFGVALGGTWADKACERRQQAALMFNMGETKVAYELMCQDDNVRSAMRVSGKPCAADIASAPVAQAPVSVAAPTSTAAAAPAPVVIAVAQVADASRPEWCAKAAPTTEASKTYVAQVCGR
jgi:hypothetical protein